jgi:hypothetical protein
MMYEQQAQQLQGAVPQATQIQKAKQAVSDPADRAGAWTVKT